MRLVHHREGLRRGRGYLRRGVPTVSALREPTLEEVARYHDIAARKFVGIDAAIHIRMASIIRKAAAALEQQREDWDLCVHGTSKDVLCKGCWHTAYPPQGER